MLNPITIIINYAIVQVSIILFFLPFYLLYRYKHPDHDDEHRSISDRLEGFFLSKQSNYLVFFWAMGEALVWFVIPEFLLLLVVFMRIRRKRELLVYDVGGTAVGTIIAFYLHASNQAISNLPYIRPKMVDQTIAWFSQHGVWGLLYQPFSGVPYKVFTLTANRFGFYLLWFLIVAVVVRMSRYVVFFGIFLAIYPALHKFVYRNYVRLFFATTFIFTILLLRVVGHYSL